MLNKSLRTIPALFNFFYDVPADELEGAWYLMSLRKRMPNHLALRSYAYLEYVLEWPGAFSDTRSIYAALGDNTKERLLNALILAEADLLDKFAVWEYTARTNAT